MSYHTPSKYSGLLLAVLLSLILASCESGPGDDGLDNPTDPKPVLKVLSPSNITETGLQINWSVEDPFGFQSIGVQVAANEDMTGSITYVVIDDISTEHVVVDNLQGATTYYYRVSLLDQSGPLVESEIKSVETTFKQESITLVTEDEYELSGKLAYLESLPGKRPGIILMHEFGVWVNPWPGSPLMRQLVADGYICLTFFFRGHGTSTPVDDLMDLLNNRDLLARDLQAAIDHMIANERSSGKLGLMGGSMGAIMALAGNGYDEVLTSVALSPVSDGVFVIFPNMTLNSAYYLAGELDVRDDPPIDCPAEAQALYNQTEEPRKIHIIPGTADHGTSLLSRDSLNASVLTWFHETLPLIDP